MYCFKYYIIDTIYTFGSRHCTPKSAKWKYYQMFIRWCIITQLSKSTTSIALFVMVALYLWPIYKKNMTNRVAFNHCPSFNMDHDVQQVNIRIDRNCLINKKIFKVKSLFKWINSKLKIVIIGGKTEIVSYFFLSAYKKRMY